MTDTRTQKLAAIADAYAALADEGNLTDEQDAQLTAAILEIEGPQIVGAEWAAELAGMSQADLDVLDASPLFKRIVIPPQPEE